MAKPPPPASSSFWRLFNAFGRLQVRLIQLSGGRVGGKLMGVPVLVLHHRGRKTGQARKAPLMYLRDGADVEVGGERRRVRPRLADAEERARLWPRLVDLYPPYEEYQSFTSRRIPVVVLEPAGFASR